MSTFTPSRPPPFLAASALCLLIIGCGPPDRGDGDYMPWGGIELEDDDDADDDGNDGESDGGAVATDDGGDSGGSDGPGDDGPSEDEGDSGDDGDPVDEPPGSPYAGGWDIGTCQDQISPTGTGVGQVVPDFLLYDQFGDQVRLYDFCHEAVYIVAGAFW